MTSERATTSRRLARRCRRPASRRVRESREVPRGERGEDGDTRLLHRAAARGGGGEPRSPSTCAGSRGWRARRRGRPRRAGSARALPGPHGVRGEERGGEPREGRRASGWRSGRSPGPRRRRRAVGEQDGEGVEDDVAALGSRTGGGGEGDAAPSRRPGAGSNRPGRAQAADRGGRRKVSTVSGRQLFRRVARQVLAPVVVAPERRGAARGTVVPLGGRGIRREGAGSSPSLARRRARPRWTRGGELVVERLFLEVGAQRVGIHRQRQRRERRRVRRAARASKRRPRP